MEERVPQVRREGCPGILVLPSTKTSAGKTGDATTCADEEQGVRADNGGLCEDGTGGGARCDSPGTGAGWTWGHVPAEGASTLTSSDTPGSRELPMRANSYYAHLLSGCGVCRTSQGLWLASPGVTAITGSEPGG